MRNIIVHLLKSAGGNFLSGEEIATTLGISRAAVWKHIQKLRGIGYDIVSRERCGYRLGNAPDILLPSEIQAGLRTKIIGREISYHPSIESTNRMAKCLVYANAADGTVVVAEEQTGGKGRLDRSFFSPRGKGIWFSIILRPKFLPMEATKCTFLAAVAVALAMERFNLKAQIKWPNDILYEGRKIVGILTELGAEMSRITYLIVGIGINVNIRRDEFPEDIRDRAASLSEIAGAEIPRVDFFRAVLEEFDKLYIEANEHGFDEVVRLWKKYNITLNHDVKVIPINGKIIEGHAIDIDMEGALLVQTAKGIEHIFAGDVSIR